MSHQIKFVNLSLIFAFGVLSANGAFGSVIQCVQTVATSEVYSFNYDSDGEPVIGQLYSSERGELGALTCEPGESKNWVCTSDDETFVVSIKRSGIVDLFENSESIGSLSCHGAAY